jgi:hypothetical protein
MTIKTCKTAVRASAVLAAIALSGGAFGAGAAGDSYDFESGSGDLSETGLTGNGTYATATTTAPAVGYPLPSSAHTKVLEIAGTVTYTNSAAAGDITSGSSQVDFMFKVEPTDELENPDGADIQVALAVGVTNATGTTAPILLWCKNVSGAASADWVTLKESVTTGAWVRATLVLDYSGTTKRCKISLDGDPVLNTHEGTEWFYFAGTDVGQQFVKSISMVGSTQVDDLKVSYDALTEYAIPGGSTTVAASGQGSNVTYAYINKYGVTVEQATSPTPVNAESGLSVADKFAAGLDPKSATQFALQTMATTKSSATVTFPGTKPVGSYTVKAKTAGGTQVATGTVTKASTEGENVNSAVIDLTGHEDELLYFTVEAN